MYTSLQVLLLALLIVFLLCINSACHLSFTLQSPIGSICSPSGIYYVLFEVWKSSPTVFFTYGVPIPLTLVITDYIKIFNFILICVIFIACLTLFVFSANKSLMNTHRVEFQAMFTYLLFCCNNFFVYLCPLIDLVLSHPLIAAPSVHEVLLLLQYTVYLGW